MSIKDLVERYEREREIFRKPNYNESQLRVDFLDAFFELLGWDVSNKSGEPSYEREVLVEEGLKAGAGANTKKPDYTFRLFSERKFFAEAKKPSVAIERNDATARQIRRYGYTADLKISVATNFEYLIIYDCTESVKVDDGFQKRKVKEYHYSQYVDSFDEINYLIGKSAVYSGNFDAKWAFIEDRVERQSIDELFLRQINNWRLLLGQKIYEFDSTIEEQDLNDHVQSYINRIIFLRVCEDRNLEEYQTLLNLANEANLNQLLEKFIAADKKYNSGLFDQFLSDEIIGNTSSVFWNIIKQLYYPESAYSFSVLSSDILGRIYEVFLTETLVIRNNNIRLQSKPENIDKDIVSTPNHIVKDLLRETVIPYVKNKNDKELLMIKIADIACGSGAFLLEAFQLMNNLLIDFYLKNDTSKLAQIGIHSYKLPFELKKQLLHNCIYGVDKDFNAVEATKFGLLLQLLENEDVNTIGIDYPILPDLSESIGYGNSLLEPRDIDVKYWDNVNPYDFKGIEFDIIVGNPPYMKSGDMKNIIPLEYKFYKENYEFAYKQFDKYFLFIEQTTFLLKEGGYFGYILPNKFAKVGAGKMMRRLLQSGKCISKIVSFGANQIFKSKSTYTCLLIGQDKVIDTFQFLEVQNLNDWKTRQFSEVDYQPIDIERLDNENWVLIPKGLDDVVTRIRNRSISLVNITQKDGISNGIQTSGNKIYVFEPIAEDTDYYVFEKNGQKHTIEKELTKPFYTTSGKQDNLYTYRPFEPNCRVIYPYRKTADGLDIVPIEDLQNNFPNLYQYLLSNKSNLEKRNILPKPQTANEWYRYGRHQSLERCEVDAKIVVGVLAIGNKYAIDYNQTLIASGGTAGYCMITLPENSPYSIYYIQAVLNSKYIEWYSSLIGEVFRGGYIARGTKILKQLPIPTINFDNEQQQILHDDIAKRQKYLIAEYQKVDQYRKNNERRKLVRTERGFNQILAIQNEKLTELFGLEDLDTLVPSIQELYATH
ncbi:MAG: N-6 DNA methylase [Saprospiraceae bacterium]